MIDKLPSERPQNGELKNFAYTKIRENIINCIYAPGSILSEQQLTEDLQLSRTPIREALNRIEQEGLIRIVPKKGVFVSDITVNDVVQIFYARGELEPIIVRMAGPNAQKDVLCEFYKKFEGDEVTIISGLSTYEAVDLDMQMHEYFANNCGNSYFTEIMQKIFSHNRRVVIATKQEGVRIHDAKREHLDILSALLEDDYNKAEDKMRLHIQSCKEAAFMHFMSGFSPY